MRTSYKWRCTIWSLNILTHKHTREHYIYIYTLSICFSFLEIVIYCQYVIYIYIGTDFSGYPPLEKPLSIHSTLYRHIHIDHELHWNYIYICIYMCVYIHQFHIFNCQFTYSPFEYEKVRSMYNMYLNSDYLGWYSEYITIKPSWGYYFL